MIALSLAQRLAGHVQHLLGDGPFPQPGGWTHMGAVICDASFHARCAYEATLRPRLLRLQKDWPDATTVRGFQGRLATEDLAVAMHFNHSQKVATAHAITDLLAGNGVDTRDDLHAWLDHRASQAALRTVKGVGPKTVDYIGNLVGRSQVAVDVHLRAFAADAGVPGLRYEQLRVVYEEAAVLLGHDQGGLEHAIWRYKSGAA
ncbi:HhH-GDP family DNA glycosylase [Streptomyces prasinus]